MSSHVVQDRKYGIIISRPVSVLFFLIYLLQSAVLVYFVYEYYHQQQTITHQQKKIVELEEKLQILHIIEDFQIGFTDTEIGQLTNVVHNESKRYGYDPRLLLAVIMTESSFRKGQKSYVGAEGLMQVMPYVGADVAKRRGIAWKGKLSLFEPSYNVKLGSLYLFELIMKFNDVQKAIIAYNLGETEVRKRLHTNHELPSKYLRKVLDRYQQLREKYPDV